MKIDISRLNLSEKDIEDWLYENPNRVTTTWGIVTEWIGRQYHLPSGIADLIGVTDGGMVVLIEVKNVPINKAALTQVCRYAADLTAILYWRFDYPNPELRGLSHIEKIIVGPSIDDQTFTEAVALDIDIHEFSVSLVLDLGVTRWTQGTTEMLSKRYREIAHQPEWDRFGKHTDDLQREWEEREKSGDGNSDDELGDDFDSDIKRLAAVPTDRPGEDEYAEHF